MKLLFHFRPVFTMTSYLKYTFLKPNSVSHFLSLLVLLYSA